MMDDAEVALIMASPVAAEALHVLLRRRVLAAAERLRAAEQALLFDESVRKDALVAFGEHRALGMLQAMLFSGSD